MTKNKKNTPPPLHERGELEEEAPERPDVGLVVVRLLVHLLRRHVERRPDVGVRKVRLRREHAGKAEVAEFEALGLVDEDVGGLDVAVEDPLLARVALVHGEGDLEEDGPDLGLLQARAVGGLEAGEGGGGDPARRWRLRRAARSPSSQNSVTM
jgi:hypothetical protein